MIRQKIKQSSNVVPKILQGNANKYNNHLNTGLVRYSKGRKLLGIQMASEYRTKKSNIPMVIKQLKQSDIVRSLPFEYWTTTVSGIQMNLIFGCLVFRWLLYNEKNPNVTGGLNDHSMPCRACNRRMEKDSLGQAFRPSILSSTLNKNVLF